MQTPCLAAPTTVRWIDPGGTYRLEPLDQWREERADAAAEEAEALGTGPHGTP